jgi:hypothetical protein
MEGAIAQNWQSERVAEAGRVGRSGNISQRVAKTRLKRIYPKT